MTSTGIRRRHTKELWRQGGGKGELGTQFWSNFLGFQEEGLFRRKVNCQGLPKKKEQGRRRVQQVGFS